MSLLVLQAVGLATLMRSIAYDRWITVLASLFLVGGALAAQRGRTWGIAMSFAAAVSFPVAFAIGIAPPWFCLVGLAGLLPLALTWRPLARFDKGAAAVLAGSAVAAGAATAMAWKEMAWSVFASFPSLMPSRHAHHEVVLLATVAVAVGLLASQRRSRVFSSDVVSSEPLAHHARVRIGESDRVSDSAAVFDEASEQGELSDDAHGADAAMLQRRRSS
jgi:hypothetical protein